jgi:hypothetical protein
VVRVSILKFVDSPGASFEFQKMTGEKRGKGGTILWKAALALIGAGLIGFGGWFYLQAALRAQAEAFEAAVSEYVAAVHKIERGFVESLPIYQDYATAAKEAKLREFLLADHLDAARRFGVSPVADEASLGELTAAGSLVAVENTAETGFYFYNVPGRFRYLTPGAAAGLNSIADRLQRVLAEKEAVRRQRAARNQNESGDGAPNGNSSAAAASNLPVVKFAVSSMLRPTGYQARLRGRNANASLVSSHSQGVSFDLFYDEFYVQLADAAGPGAAAVQETLRRRLGYLMGAALRRQFRAALTETLLQLQEEGLIYVILEKRQRCYHVTVLR